MNEEELDKAAEYVVSRFGVYSDDEEESDNEDEWEGGKVGRLRRGLSVESWGTVSQRAEGVSLHCSASSDDASRDDEADRQHERDGGRLCRRHSMMKSGLGVSEVQQGHLCTVLPLKGSKVGCPGTG